MIQQKVRKKKKTCFNVHAGGKRNLIVQYIEANKQNVAIKKLSYVKV